MARAIIIGAGHEGLVCACSLAKAGHKVEIYERLDTVGGCATTDETTFPGFKISSASYVNSLFLSQVVGDLNLKAYGYEVLARDPFSLTPLPDGRYLLLGRDREANIEEIRKFSDKDARRYPEYEDALDEIAGFMSSLMTLTPPNIPPRCARDMKGLLTVARRFFRLRPIAMKRFVELMTTDARIILNKWFESEPLKATLLTDSAIGTFGFSGYVLLHHVMGEAGGARGVWGYQRGGMGGISNALAAAARNLGVVIHTGKEVCNIKVDDGGLAYCISLVSGGLVGADCVISNADPKRTVRLLERDACERFARKFARRVRELDFSSPVMKINLTLSDLPNFKCMPGTNPLPHHRATIHISPDTGYIERAHDDASRGVPSFEPILEITLPSVIDDTLAPPGKHTMGIFVQYAPYHLANGHSWDDIKSGYFWTNIVMNVLSRYITNIRDIIEGVEILSPLDLERRFGITEGNIFHGAMSLGQLFSFRPVRGYADYRTPIKGLYMCGAGTHPGGGVTGACGYNAAREVLADIGEYRK